MKPAREPASSRPKPCASLKRPHDYCPVRRSLLALVGRKQTAVRDQPFPQKPPGSRLALWSRDVGSAVPPRVTLPIFRSRSKSDAYSQAPSSLPVRFPRRYASFGTMTVGTNGLACGFNWQCTANDAGYAVSWSHHAWTPHRLLTSSTVWVHPGREAAGAGCESWGHELSMPPSTRTTFESRFPHQEAYSQSNHKRIPTAK